MSRYITSDTYGGIGRQNEVSIRGLMTMTVAVQEDVDKLKVRQTSLEDEVLTLKVTNLTAEAVLKQLKKQKRKLK